MDDYNPPKNSPRLTRLWCKIFHPNQLQYFRGPMGLVDGYKCKVCGAYHDVG